MSIISEADYVLLVFIRDGDGIVRESDRDRADQLYAGDYIIFVNSFFKSVRVDGFDQVSYDVPRKLTPKGEDAISSFVENRRKAAEEEEKHRLNDERENELARKDTRHFWIQLIVHAVIAIFCVFLGALLASKTNLFDWMG